MDSRVVKSKTPPRIIVASVLIGLFILGFIFFAIWYSGHQISTAKMAGVITQKQFVPLTEVQITFGRQGGLNTHEKDGDYVLTVDVPQEDGTQKPYNVWVSKKLYDSLQVGERFDVGPYVVPES
jgi:hypothetical protein